jgi:hypothetical protein
VFGGGDARRKRHEGYDPTIESPAAERGGSLRAVLADLPGDTEIAKIAPKTNPWFALSPEESVDLMSFVYERRGELVAPGPSPL